MACAAPRCKTKNVFVRYATVIGRVKPAARSSPSPASDRGRITEFNITNSMGRLTLNIPLSFAQFERAVTGERIRDKIAASKRNKCGWEEWFLLATTLRDANLTASFHFAVSGAGTSTQPCFL
jgi:hypothetical protein